MSRRYNRIRIESKECLDLIIENNIKMVLGNHELCALYGTDIDSSINSNVQKNITNG